VAGVGAATSAAPHFGQKAKPGAQTNAQAGQLLDRGRPHFGQKANSGAASNPHPAQLIGNP